MKKITGAFAVLVIGLLSLLAYVVIENKTHSSADVSIDSIEQIDSLETLSNVETSAPSEEVAEVAEATDATTESIKQTMIATFTTNKGNFDIELFNTLAPKTVENFVTLAESNFYDGVKFHRVISDFMVQAGDPLSKDEDLSDRWGTGGPGYTFEDEIHAENNNVIGTISMANAGPNTNGSQFFINTADNDFLNTKHTVFGKVVSGFESVKAIEAVEKFPNDRPVEPVVITSIKISQ